MAKMLPDSPPARLAKPVVRLYSQIKRIQSDDVECRLSYSLDGTRRPEFLIVFQQRYAFLLAVGLHKPEQVEAALAGTLFEADVNEGLVGQEERARIEGTLDLARQNASPSEATLVSVGRWIAYPHLSAEGIQRLASLPQLKGYLLLGKDSCASHALLEWIQSSATSGLSDAELSALKSAFSPESAIPRSWTQDRRFTVVRSNDATQTEFFLDFDQEAAVKRDLELSADASSAVAANSLSLITGVAGCGKSLVLLRRAHIAEQINQDARILALTHNKPLQLDLKARSRDLDPSSRIRWLTFFGWLHEYMQFRPIKEWEQEKLIREVVEQHDPDSDFTLEFIKDEFEWISDNAVTPPTESWYQEIERVGRFRPLGRNQRDTIFRLYREYRNALQRDDSIDWQGVPVRFLNQVRSGEIRIKPYDIIFIDEAQFFAPVWFECIKHALHPQHGKLFIVADPTQGFLRSGQSWLHVLGREVRGRAFRLERPYRNTKEILAFAKRFYLSRLDKEEGEINLPDEVLLENLPRGDPPRFIQNSSKQDERATITNEIAAALKSGLSPSNILLILADKQQVYEYIDCLSERFPDAVVSAREAIDRSKIRISTINACAGLEAPVVIIAGLEEVLHKETYLALDSTTSLERTNANTKKIFVALSRACSKLLICHRSSHIRNILEAKSKLLPRSA